MKLKIDNRERKFIDLIKIVNPCFSIEYMNLALGDMIICDDDGYEMIVIERKTLKDLVSSIKDGRYKEQSFRLNNYPVHNHNIVYLIEGDISLYSNRYTKIKPQTLYVTMFCLQSYKGFSVIKTKDISETAEYIVFTLYKMMRTPDKKNFYSEDKQDFYFH